MKYAKIMPCSRRKSKTQESTLLCRVWRSMGVANFDWSSDVAVNSFRTASYLEDWRPGQFREYSFGKADCDLLRPLCPSSRVALNDIVKERRKRGGWRSRVFIMETNK